MKILVLLLGCLTVFGCSSVFKAPTGHIEDVREVHIYILQGCTPGAWVEIVDSYQVGTAYNLKKARIEAAREVDRIIEEGGYLIKNGPLDSRWDGDSVALCDADGDTIVVDFGQE